MRIAILGAGGLGSVLGGYVARSGADVTLIGRAPHMDAIRARGLEITGLRGESVVGENLTVVTHPSQAAGAFDLLVLAVKAKDTATALRDADPLRPRVAVALSVQNGIDKDQNLIGWIGRDKVIGACTTEGGTLLQPGRVLNSVTAATTAYFGELDGSVTPRAEEIAGAFSRAGLPSRAVANIVEVEWEKLAQICIASGYSVSALLAMPERAFADGLTVREGAEHFVQLGKEVLAVYKAMGYAPQDYFAPLSRLRELNSLSFEEAVEAAMRLGQGFKERGVIARTSMHNDLLAHRKSEVDALLRPFIDKARELGIEVPTLLAVYRIAKVVDAYAD